MPTIDEPSSDAVGVSGSKFSSVPEWVWDSGLSDGAVRLYCALVSYVRGRSGIAYPSRATLARRCRCSVDKIDRLLKELVRHGAVEIERRPVEIDNHDQKTGEITKTTRHLPNNYYVFADAPEVAERRGSRTHAARSPQPRGQGVAAHTRHKEEQPFESEPKKRSSFPSDGFQRMRPPSPFCETCERYRDDSYQEALRCVCKEPCLT